MDETELVKQLKNLHFNQLYFILDSKNDSNIKISASYFIFKQYLISVNHTLPTISANWNDKQELKILINPSWNELVILEMPSDISNIPVFTKTKSKNVDSYLIDGNRFILYEKKEISIDFIPFFPRIIYYILESTKEIIKEGDSGKPVYDINNNLVGIVCKSFGKKVFILPVIYLIKTLEKKDNKNLYYLEDGEKIKRINKYYLKDMKIYYPILNMKISMDVYCVLEGDINKREYIIIDKELIKKEYSVYDIKKDTNIEIDTNFKIDNHKGDHLIVSNVLLNYLKLINKIKFCTDIFENKINKIKISSIFP